MKFRNIMCNLRYVTIDRDAARSHWWDMVEISQLNRGFWSANQRELVSQKAVAGILSHRQTRGFVFHRIREKAILRKLAAAGRTENRWPTYHQEENRNELERHTA